jgi:anti-anti-sigma factor
MSPTESTPKVAVSEARGVWSLTLSGTVGVADARALADAARATMARGVGDVVIRLTHLRGVDTSATQVLISLRRALAAQGRALRLEGTPPAVAERWRRAGLDQELSPTGPGIPAGA